MKTIKLPIQSIDIDSYIQEYNKAFRIFYKLTLSNPDLKEKEIRDIFKTYNINKDLMDSWFIQSILYEAKGFYKRTEGKKVIFGGKKNFELLKLKKITKEEWKRRRNYPLTIIGEAPQKGNRKFNFQIENNQIIFKPKFGTKIFCYLPKLHRKIRKELLQVQTLMNQKELAVTMRLSNNYIWIIFDEIKLQKPQVFKKNRFLAIDLNPNSLGYSVVEEGKILKSEIIDVSQLTQKTGKSSSSKKSLYQQNKRTHEIFEVNKYLVNKAKHFCCEAIVLEDLSTSQMLSFRSVNRLVKNQWSPSKIQENLKLKFNVVEVDAWYSSTMGNICYGEKYPDAIASSIELARRASEIKKTGKWTYSEFNNHPLINQWKEESKDSLVVGNWKCFHNWLKTSKVKYRSSTSDFVTTVFRLSSTKSKVKLLTFDRKV